MPPDLVSAAISLAVRAHHGQTYADKPYVGHLASVVNNLHLFGIQSEPMIAAAWLHDSVEDTSVTIEDVKRTCGNAVAELVYAVTNEPGKNRKERNARTYPKILAVPGAVAIKLADRIANVESCWATRDSKLFMYQREYRDFRNALREDNPEFAVGSMWDHLDELLGWWEPR